MSKGQVDGKGTFPPIRTHYPSVKTREDLVDIAEGEVIREDGETDEQYESRSQLLLGIAQTALGNWDRETGGE
jgi:hypothetical protein